MLTNTTSLLQDLFRQKRQYLDYFFDNLNIEAFELVMQRFVACKGTLFFSGVGKSGIIAEKIATTMASTGVRAIHLSPINALHGDVGIVQEGDLVVLLSKSGESDELLTLLPTLRNKGAELIAVVSNIESRLAKACHHAVELPLERELCPFGLSPTTSATLQLVFGDVLAVAMMHVRGFSIDDYAQNHPSGSIGKKMTLKVSDLMLKEDDLPLCKADAKVVDVLVELSNKRCGCLLVTNKNSCLLGIFTDGDLRRALQNYGPDALQHTVIELMTKNPRIITSDSLVWDALCLMEADQKHPIMVLPVLDMSGAVVGLVKMHDILQSGV